jgi:hypothetical protein
MSLRPASGARFALDWLGPGPGGGVGPVALYRGFVHLPDADLPLEVRVEASAAHALIAPDAGAHRPAAELRELERIAAALVRAAPKGPLAEGRPPPRRIVRWR